VLNLEELDKIRKLLKECGKSQKDLTDFLGITQNSFTNWIAGSNSSYKKYRYQIANFLGTTPGYLDGSIVCAENEKKTTGSEELAGDLDGIKKDILRYADVLSEERLRKVVDFARLLEIEQKQGLSPR
jgi:transcriptional regulator with XRE-family HTH domain